MLAAIKPIHLQLAYITRTISSIFDHVSSKEELLGTGPGANPPLWIIVHLTDVRAFFARQAGIKFKPSWGRLSIDDAAMSDASVYPELSEIAENWRELGQLLLEGLESLDEETLNKKVSRPFPINDDTFLGTLTFCAFHESYHLGQIFGWWKTLSDVPAMNILKGE